MQKNIAILLFLFLLLIFPFYSSNSQHLLFTKHFQIFSPDKILANKISALVENSYSNFVNFFGDSLQGIIKVYIAENEDRFQELAGEELPHWSLAVALPKTNTIILKSPNWHKFGRSLKEVLQHELAHIFLVNFVNGKKFPLWLNEGFAVWQSEKWGWDDKITVAKAVITNSLLSLTRIDSLNYEASSFLILSSILFRSSVFIIWPTAPISLANFSSIHDFS